MNDSVTDPAARPAQTGRGRTPGFSRSGKRRLRRAALPAALVLYLAVLSVGVALDVQASEPKRSESVPGESVPGEPQLGESVRGLDSDNPITDPAWFTQAYAEGFRVYVMASTEFGTCIPLDRTQPQLGMALDAGLKIAVYTRDPNCWEAGISATGPYRDQLQFFAIDIERVGPEGIGGHVLTREMVDGVRNMGVRPVVYSGSAMWLEIMGETTEFADVPLWDTDAGPLDYATWTADHLSPEPIPYGGWNTPDTMRIGVQQHFGRWNGVNVDLNSFDASFLR